MEKVSNKIMKRIEKLLAMSRNNKNENEAAIATKRLHALLAEYNLSEAAIEDREQDIETARFENNDGSWAFIIATAIADLYFCDMYHMRHPKKRSTVVMCVSGSAANRTIAIEIIQIVIKTIRREARTNARTVYGREERGYIKSFKNSAAYRVAQRCRDLKKSAECGTLETEDGTTLPSLRSVYESEEARIEKWYASQGHKFVTRKPRLNVTDARGSIDGRAAGDRVNLNRGITSSHARPAISHK